MEMFDVAPDVPWLDRFVSRRAVRNLGALRLFLCRRPDSIQEVAVLVGRIDVDAAQVRAQLDRLAQCHAHLSHPWIARIEERASAGEIEFVSFAGEVADDLESLFALWARKNLPPQPYAAGEGLALGVLSALEHAHTQSQQLGRIGASNILVSSGGACTIFGFGAVLERPAQGGAALFEAPAEAAELPAATRDLCAWAACMRAYRRFFARPAELDRALRAQPLERQHAWLAQNVAGLEGALQKPAGAPALSAAQARALLKQRHEKLAVQAAPEAWSECVRALLASAARERVRDGELSVQGHGERYQFEGRLGEGSTSTVYRAWDRQLRQHVAVKRLSPGGSAENVLRLLREVRTLREVRHPHLVRGYELYEDRGQVGAVMEYIPGPTLREAMTAGTLGAEQACEALSQIADALAELHRTGIVHRDIKPDNIILCAGRGAVLVDFGVASSARVSSSVTATLTDPGRVLGEATYQAPEVLAGGPATRATDVFSLACTACEALSLERNPSALSRLHEPLRSRLVQALSSDMKQRPSAVELAIALRAEPHVPAEQRRVALDGRGLWRVDGSFVDLSRRSTLRRVLAALARAHYEQPGAALARSELFSAGWPDERIDPSSAANRVYVAIAELRKLGLKGALESDGEGYLLTPGTTRTVA
jgi:predicted Ser/Thr protein kinase